MQEAPDPMTKLVWGNAALMSVATAKEKDLADGDIITISRGGMKMQAAVLTQPGHADNAITIALGFGRTKCGRVGKDVGFNAYLIRTQRRHVVLPGVEIADHRRNLRARHDAGARRRPSICRIARSIAKSPLVEYKKQSQGQSRRCRKSRRSIRSIRNSTTTGLPVGHVDRSGFLHRL